MRDAIRQASSRAHASGALQPLASEVLRIEDGGVGFVVRIIHNFADKPLGYPKKGAAAKADPFLPPYTTDLFVADRPPAHALLLNRFPVLDDHVLLVTRAFEPQDALPTPADLEALDRVLDEVDGLAFYNGGRAAGASQPHRHLQCVPREAIGDIPLERDWRLAAAQGLTEVPDWPMVHALGPATVPWETLIRTAGLALGEPHSLLATRDLRMVVPRRSGKVQGMPVNSLAFAGLLAVKGPEQLALLRTMGPMAVLGQAGRAR